MPTGSLRSRLDRAALLPLEPAADAFIIADQSYGVGGSQRVMARLGELWWMVQLDPDVGIESYELSDMEVLWTGLLVPYEPCDLPCPEDRPRYLDARSLGVATWQDEVWFGYQDLSQPHPPSPSPYCLLRMKRGCSYPVHLY